MKFFAAEGHGPKTSRLDFDGDPGYDQGIF